MALIILFVLAGLWFLPGGVGADAGLPLGPPAAAAPSSAMGMPYYAAPVQMHLCGEPVPLNEPEVREALDREFTIEVWSRAQTTMWLKRAHRYFPEIEAETAGPAAPPGPEIRGPGGERPAHSGPVKRRGPGPLAVHGPHGPAVAVALR